MKGRKLSSDDIVNLQKLLRKLGQIAPLTRHTRLDYPGIIQKSERQVLQATSYFHRATEKT